MRKTIIGVVPTLTINEGSSPFDDQFKFINSYVKKIEDAGGIPIGLLMPDGNFNEEALKICDGFLIPGGSVIRKYIYQIIHYAITNNHPLLGICLGAEAISIYSALAKYLDKENISTEELMNIYKKLKETNNNQVLIKLPDSNIHAHYNITRENTKDAMHSIKIIEGTLLADIYQTNEINVPSFHSFDLKFVEDNFIISAYALDGVKEAIEYHDPNKFILGVHFHPELGNDNKIFERLIYEAKKRK